MVASMRSSYYYLMAFALIALAARGDVMKIEAPDIPPLLGNRAIEVVRLGERPVIDGTIEWAPRNEALRWAPVFRPQQLDAKAPPLFTLGWRDDGLYLGVIATGASLDRKMGTGETPPAPFVVEWTLDAQPEPDADETGRHVVRMVPLVDPVDPLEFGTVRYLRNRGLAAGSKIGDDGLVVVSETTTTHMDYEKVEARWANTKDGLTLEAFVPWSAIPVERSRPSEPFFVNVMVSKPGAIGATWIAGSHGKRLAAGRVQIRFENQEPDASYYRWFTLPILTPLPLHLQNQPLKVAVPLFGPVKGQEVESFSLTRRIYRVSSVRIDSPSKHVSSAQAITDPETQTTHAEIPTTELRDGNYELRAHFADDEESLPRPIYIAGNFVRETLNPARDAATEQLAALRNSSNDTQTLGHLARAEACLRASNLPPGTTVADLRRTVDAVNEAAAILEAVEKKNKAPLGSVGGPGGFSADGMRGNIEFVPTSNKRARLTIDANDLTPWQASPLIYGTFSEPLGFGWPLYGALWAQKIQNPSFEPGSPAADVVLRRADVNAVPVGEILRGEWLPLIDDKQGKVAQDNIAAPWLGVGTGDARFSLVGDAYNTKFCQRIEAKAGAKNVGVAQIVDLQVWRCQKYRFRVYLRSHKPGAAVVASLLNVKKVVSSSRIDGIGAEWKAFDVEFKAPHIPGRRSAFLIALTLEGEGVVDIDQATITPDDAIGGFDPQAVDQVREMKTGWVRWPGGNYASGYRWRDGIGPLDKRRTLQNIGWDGLDTNLMGTDEYLRFCELADLEPLICVNAGDGSPEEAADWVEYCNGAADSPMGRLRAANGRVEPYGIKHWNIGNELWGRWQVGYCEAAEHARRYETFAAAMRERDPSIELIACGHTPYPEEKSLRWTRALLERLGKNFETIDFHTYIDVQKRRGLGDIDCVEALAAMPIAYEQCLMEFRRLSVEMGAPQARVDVGEYNNRRTDGLPGRLQLTSNMLASAGWLHGFLRQGEYVMGANATEFSVFNPRNSELNLLHPRYLITRLYASKLGRRPVRARLETPVLQRTETRIGHVPPIFNLPLVDPAVMKNEADGSLGIGLINRDLRRAIEVEIVLSDFEPDGAAERYLYVDAFEIDAPSPSPQRPVIEQSKLKAGRSFTVTLPAHSVTLVIVRPRK